MRRMLVAVDGSKNSVRAVEFASEIAAQFKAEVTLFLAIPPSDAALFSGKDTYFPRDKSLYDGRFAEAAKILEERGVNFRKQWEFGQPAEEILKAAAEGYDAIVVGSRGLSAVEGFLLGSVSSKVVHHSKIPTIVVP